MIAAGLPAAFRVVTVVPWRCVCCAASQGKQSTNNTMAMLPMVSPIAEQSWKKCKGSRKAGNAKDAFGGGKGLLLAAAGRGFAAGRGIGP